MPLPLQHFSPAHSPHGRGGIRCFAALSAALLTGHPPPHSSTTSARLGASSREDWAGSRADRNLLVLLCQRGARCFASICK